MDYLRKNPIWTGCEWIQKYLPYHHKLKGKRVLDVGCGTSLIAYALVEKAGVKSYTGIDNNVEVFAPCHDPWVASVLPYRKALVEQYPEKITYKQMTGENIEFRDESFDFVMALTVTEHLSDPEKMFKEIARVLVPGGYFFFNHHNFYSWDGHHQGPYDVQALEGELTDLQKELMDWGHLEKDIQYEEYEKHEKTFLNRIRWFDLMKTVEKTFFIVTWKSVYSPEKRGAARLTGDILSRFSHAYLYEDLAVMENVCLCKKLTRLEENIVGELNKRRKRKLKGLYSRFLKTYFKNSHHFKLLG